MKALLFGSIGAVVETSELQRRAFNEAFSEHGLDWTWGRDAYRDMLAKSGGKARIERYGAAKGMDVDADAIHATKSRIFAELLESDLETVRPGVLESLRVARELGLKTGFASTTEKASIDRVLAMQDGVLADLFDLTLSDDDGYRQKPDPEPFLASADRLGVLPREMLVVEDNEAGLQAAKAAGATVIAYLGANTQSHDTAAADFGARDDVFPVVLGALTAEQRKAS